MREKAHDDDNRRLSAGARWRYQCAAKCAMHNESRENARETAFCNAPFFLRLSHEIIMLQLTMMMICTNMHVVKDRIKIGNVGNFASLE